MTRTSDGNINESRRLSLCAYSYASISVTVHIGSMPIYSTNFNNILFDNKIVSKLVSQTSKRTQEETCSTQITGVPGAWFKRLGKSSDFQINLQ